MLPEAGMVPGKAAPVFDGNNTAVIFADTNPSDMYKKILMMAIAAITLGSSCSDKDKSTPSPYNATIQGVNLTTVDAVPAGSIGSPDVKTYADQYFQMIVYPNPSINVLRTQVIIANKEPLTLTAKLISAVYNNPPEGTVIENADRAGQVVLSQSKDLPIAQPDSTGSGGIHNIPGVTDGQSVLLDFEVSALPRGFYRLYIETSKGDIFWDNIWISR